MVKKFNMGWGNPHFLLEILQEQLPNLLYSPKLTDMIYGPYEGTADMINKTHQVIEDTTGRSYEYILMTNGASSAINILLRYMKKQGYRNIHTSYYGYPSYEEMIKRAGLNRIRDYDNVPTIYYDQLHNGGVRLIDSPENPTGIQFTGGDPSRDIWDGVYHNEIYTSRVHLQPKHKFFVSSYSKLLGLAGMRLGFIATNDYAAYQALYAEARNENTGVSRASQEILCKILKNLDLNAFMRKGNTDLCYNKEEFQKIEYLFDHQPVGDVGMFYCVKADEKAIQTLEKANVEFVRLDQDTIRLSMGNTKQHTKDGIAAILKEDKGG